MPGGSSGGSAVALAAGLSALEIGSDIGASIRNPAHYCGVYGHKPSYGIASMSGHELPAMVDIDSLDIAVIGPMSRSAGDLALALDIIAGVDEINGTGWQLKLPKPEKKNLSDYKVAILYTDTEAEVDQSVQEKLQDLAGFLVNQRVHCTRKYPSGCQFARSPSHLYPVITGSNIIGINRCVVRTASG